MTCPSSPADLQPRAHRVQFATDTPSTDPSIDGKNSPRKCNPFRAIHQAQLAPVNSLYGYYSPN